MSVWTQGGDTTGATPGEVWALTREFVDGVAEHGYVRLGDGFRALNGMGVPDFASAPIVAARRVWPLADQGKRQITEQMVEDGARALAYRLADLDWPGTTVVSAPIRFEHRSGARAVLEAALGKGGEQ